MKIISYSIFGGHSPKWIFNVYLRGIYFNVVMNKLVYNSWQTHIETDSKTFSAYDHFFNLLKEKYNISFDVNAEENLCTSMAWRLKPVFNPDSEYVLCRDADALTSYREAGAVKQFVDSGLILHGISDNPAHSIPLMGGLCGFKCKPLREKYGSWQQMITQSPVDINERGTDQTFLNSVVHRDFGHSLYSHLKNPAGKLWKSGMVNAIPDDRKNPLWESNLCTSYIGAAGVNEMETIRFFQRFDKEFTFCELWKKYPELFYWHE